MRNSGKLDAKAGHGEVHACPNLWDRGPALRREQMNGECRRLRIDEHNPQSSVADEFRNMVGIQSPITFKGEQVLWVIPRNNASPH